MDSISAFIRGAVNSHKELMVFDWEKAAQIIKEKGARYASAGLREDWEWTGGEIFRDGKPLNREDTYTFLASTWAVPELEVQGEIIPCYRMQSETPGWNAETFWPTEALAIVEAEKEAKDAD
ncbi:MAG: hypothetical protein A4E65_01155 [Syntrophorhabdus sp. PtaU1.Bin153]|nr:MAG: hypothetical protein A4E65_01155 [Syntrophorhabdus sp. PtaU1.Bin153]